MLRYDCLLLKIDICERIPVMSENCEIAVIGQCTVPPDWIGMVKNDINRLYYIHSGNGGYIKDGVRTEFVSGRLYLIPAFSKIRTYAPQENRIYHTYADFALIPPIISKDVLTVDPAQDPDIEAALGVFLSMCKNRETLKNPDREKYLCDTLVFLSKKIAERNDSTVLRDNAVLTALNYIHTNFKEKFSIADLAEICHMSPEGFIRKFKSYIGETPYSYLKRLKLRVALRLRNSGMSWDEIADFCGYADSSTLLHAIKSSNSVTY